MTHLGLITILLTTREEGAGRRHCQESGTNIYFNLRSMEAQYIES